ncbi:MAG TPA: DUF5717 family protein [Mobilitalea sp.]|nr:DUF5717 family protein [Mobilitalea sp.]
MKEKIERFSKGDFEYELPFICLSEEEIRLTAETGKKLEGSFIISNSIGREMTGVVYSSDRLLKIKNPSFQGTTNTICYEFDSVYLKEGERIDGDLCIVSDCGEKLLPFTIQTKSSHFVTSLGKIKDLFQFTNLARMDWSEAKKVFRSEDFERILLSNEDRYRFVYRNLIKSISTSQALEEFLITIHKKAVIRLDIDRSHLEYDMSQDSITDKLVLSKNNWGYAEIRVSTDAPFIQMEQKFLWADRFTSNTHQISFRIDAKNLMYGKNYGNIYIKTAHQTITVDVLCRYGKEDNKVSDRRLQQRAEYALVDNYLSFRLNRISLIEYLEDAEAMLKQLPGPEISRFKELMMIHLSIVSGKTKIADELLADIEAEELALKKKSVLEYCAYLYLKALYQKEASMIDHAADMIRSYYEKGLNDWRLLWLLLNTDRRYEKNKAAKLSDIREQFEAGCRSSIIYYEALSVINEEPYLLRELNEFEIQVLHFGIRNWILGKEAAQQFIYLSNKKKNFDPVIFRGLEKLYDEYGTTEILTAICCMLIKGMKKAEKYFEWYRLGVEAQLRITELYEYYMYTISDTMQGSLAQPVLLYFIYNSSLSDKKKAYLYANIVRNKDKNEPIYRTYYKRMEVFASKLLEGHYISHDLAVLYKEFFDRNTLGSELTRLLPYVIYRNELICSNPNIGSVVIIHKELGVEENIPIVNGKAQVDIYTNNVEIFLADSFGNRFVESVEYSVTPFLNSEDFESHCIEYSNHPMLLLHLFDRYQSYRIMNPNAIELRKKVLLMEGLAREYVTSCCQTLIDYYYENYNDELLEYYLEMIDLPQVRPQERPRFLEGIVARSFYHKALEVLETFGVEGVGINRLVKLCSGWMLRPEAETKQDFMVYLCYYVFSHRKYDIAILHYLVDYFDGSTREMFQLWKAAKEFELDTHKLEERLLIQILFSESYIEDSFRVFDSYYKDITNRQLVRAFLSFFAYKYLVHNYVIAPELFPIMKRELYYEENDVCLLAWLKYHSSNQDLTENELIFVEFNLQRLIRNQIILPFFLDYKNRVVLPDRILDKCFLTYYADPKKQVYIHYRLLKQDGTEFITERMPNVFQGIHLKEFVLFYHEAVQYYITEESPAGTNITESFHTQYEGETPEEDDSKYNQINLMLITLEMQDDNTLHFLMDNYMKNEFMIEECFKPVE